MSKTIQSAGSYSIPSGMPNAGQEVEYSFEYEQFDNLQDAINEVGEVEALALIQRMTKVDSANVARENAKRKNGHSTTKPMTEEAKAEAKLERQANKKLLEALKAKGINSLDELNTLIG